MQKQFQEQVEVLEQKQKFLTFEEICKEWSMLIAKHGGFMKVQNYIFDRKTQTELMPREGPHTPSQYDLFTRYVKEQKLLSLGEYDTCIVGEAHGFNENYENTCRECFKFSMTFGCTGEPYDNRYGIQIESDADFERVKEQFVNHFNEAHVP